MGLRKMTHTYAGRDAWNWDQQTMWYTDQGKLSTCICEVDAIQFPLCRCQLPTTFPCFRCDLA